MRNPVFSSLTTTAQRNPGAFSGTQTQAPPQFNTGNPGSWSQQQHAAQAQWAPQPPAAMPPASAESFRAMTVDDVITKTGITLAVIIVGAVVNFFLSLTNPGVSSMLTLVGGFGGFITVMVSAFTRRYGSAPITLIYAAFEGLFVGGLSAMFARVGSSDGVPAYDMILQAVIGTIGVFLGMLYAYKSGAIKVTSRFRRGVTGALFGVVIMSLGSMLIGMFTGHNPLYNGGLLSIAFSVVCIVIAAASFLTDFDSADRFVRAGVPANYAWGVALGLAVTLVWCYTEILRLLAMLNRNN